MSYFTTTLVFKGTKQAVSLQAVPRQNEFIEYTLSDDTVVALQVEKVCYIIHNGYCYDIQIHCTLL